jgi:hypothetical protein
MLLLEEKTMQIDDLLDKMAQSVQLDNSRYQRMKQHYEAVQNWIEGDEKFFKPYKYDVYPHGSVRIQTTVKPISKDEFDLDIAIHLKSELSAHTPQRIYDELKRRLMEHETYQSMLEPKNRCLRLNYAKDFHMDILPGIQENYWDENKLKVPDRDLGRWVSSNPKGYAGWFLEKANEVEMGLIEKALRAENIPADDFEQKKPLQRAVQLIKRDRDIFFQKDDTYKTSSIILTTIAGQFYAGQESIFETVDHIITTLQNKIGDAHTRIKIVNPVNPEEDFTDKWKKEPQYYKAFQSFCLQLYQDWQTLKKSQGVINEGRIFKGLFGEDVYINAQTEQAKFIERLRTGGRLGIEKSTGTLSSLSSSTVSIKRNTFFGA